MQKAKAIYDCTADGDGELSFKEGDILINVTESAEDGWYVGRLEGTSREGLFPYNYVEFIAVPTLPSKSIPEPQRSDMAQKQQQDNVGRSPSPSPLSSTWYIVSAKRAQEENEPPIKAADAFEKTMNFKPVAARTQAVVSRTTTFEKPPTLAPKPSQFRDTFGTTAAPPVKSKPVGLPPPAQASACKNEPFRIIQLKPTTGQHVPIKNPSFESSMAEEDDFQIVSLPLLSQRRAELKPAGSSLPKPAVAQAKKHSNGIFSDLQPAANPAPRLPSRPTANKRRPKSTSPKAIVSTESSTTSISSPPEIKQKPIQLANPNSPIQKPRSPSNPPPLQPKPSLAKPVTTSNSNFSSTTTTGSRQHDIPRFGVFSSMTPIALPGLSSPLPGSRPPKALGSNGFSPLPAPGIPLLHSSSAIPLPGLASDLLTQVSVASRLEQWQQRSQETPTQYNPVTSSGCAEKTMDPPLKNKLAPNASAAAAHVISRYEDLFNKIQDGGVVDAQTAKVIWERSRVSDEALAKIWKKCDPQGSGKLNKAGFIQGLREIDALLAQSDKVPSAGG